MSDRRAAGAALETIGRIGELLTLLEEEPAGLLRSGGVAVRDQKRIARALHVDEADAGWLLELAHAAGLLDVGGPHRDEWLPTRAYDVWREQDLADRWATSSAAGWTARGCPSLVGQRDVAGKARQRPLPRPGAAHRGRHPPRRAGARWPSTRAGSGLAPEELVELLRWRTPRRADRLAPVPGMLDEATRLGVLVGGVLSAGGRGLLTSGEDGAADGMRGLLPEPVDHVLAQPDLSLVAPGPLVAELADTLAVVADVESSGGATVFRVSEASVRRALDSGWSATDLHEFFTRASRTPVPQALDYLVDDVARQHGRLRVGSIESYVRSDDHGLLSQVLNDRRAANAELRRLAPGVLVSGLGADEVLTVLREAGYAPAGESSGRRRPHPAAGPAARPGPEDDDGDHRRAPAAHRGRAGRDRAGDPGRRRGAVGPARRGGAPDPGRDHRRHPGAAVAGHPRGPAGVAGLRRRAGQRQPAGGAAGVAGRGVPAGVRRGPRRDPHLRRPPDHLGGAGRRGRPRTWLSVCAQAAIVRLIVQRRRTRSRKGMSPPGVTLGSPARPLRRHPRSKDCPA